MVSKLVFFANELESGEEFELGDAISLYDGDKLEAFCGLEDFHVAIWSWCNFIDDGY